MLTFKILTILLVSSLAASELITFKPFIKSRYSVRDRTRNMTKSIHLKTNGTSDNPIPNANNEYGSTHHPTEHLATTVGAFLDENLKQDSKEKIDYKLTSTTPMNKMRNEKEASSTAKTETVKSPGTTEWIYDYYASDDEGSKTK